MTRVWLAGLALLLGCSSSSSTGGSSSASTGSGGGASASSGSTSTAGTGGAGGASASSASSGGASASSSSAGTGGAGGASSSASASGSASSSSSTGGGAPVYCGHPGDCAQGQICGAAGTCQPGPCSTTAPCIFGYDCQPSGACVSPKAGACDQSSECDGDALCLDGVCTERSGFCLDGVQCAAGEHCLEGGCLPACASNSDCPGGVGCDTTLGICVQAAKSCTITNDCGSATQVCVGGDCVPRSAGGACSAGLVWNENGCVPPQAKLSACSTEGVRGTCAAGSICLQGSCWISCDAPNQNACASQATLNTCKPISSAGATYNVCATAKSLGSQCNPPADVECAAGSACLDGFCK